MKKLFKNRFILTALFLSLFGIIALSSGGEYLHSLAHHHEEEHAAEQCPIGKFLIQPIITVSAIFIAHSLIDSETFFIKALNVNSFLELYLPEGRAPPTLA